jgi:malonate-semialdehyde dehydrogenase (acetylating)/methylmalonate-semialdehyde dehydrogenase
MTKLPDAIADGTVPNFIGGKWQTSTGDDGQAVVDPATNETLAYVPFATENEVDETVAAAREAFEGWRERPVEERIQPMFRYKSLLEDHHDELARLLVREHGKTFDEAAGELRRGIENVEVACGIPRMMQAGYLENAAPEIDEMAVRQPLGVFAGITPFNFPGMIPLWFMPYAIATGNAFILKPSERDPLVPTRLIELAAEAGFPDGVVNLVNGGADTVNALLDHPGIEGVSFVGSTPIAEHVYERAAANGKRVQAQGGAKNHILVSANADLEFAAKQTIGSAFANAGERCLANPVCVVEDDVYDEFTDLVVEQAKAMTVGNGLDDGVDMGALISPEHQQTVESYIQTGMDEGGEILLDGRECEVDEEGNFLGPTIFGDVTTDMVIAQEEIFGPVLALIRAEDFDTALDIQRASEFGNAASLFTQDGGEAKRFRHDAEAGNLGINIGTAAPMAFFHFGGQKNSFFGDLHAQAEDVVRFYTDETVVIERWPNT